MNHSDWLWTESNDSLKRYDSKEQFIHKPDIDNFLMNFHEQRDLMYTPTFWVNNDSNCGLFHTKILKKKMASEEYCIIQRNIVQIHLWGLTGPVPIHFHNIKNNKLINK